MKKDINKIATIKRKSSGDSVLTSPRSAFPVVAIGASAGGLEALEQFFGNMPVDSGMAFVIIQHLDPNHEGIMPELLQRTTRMKVTQVTDHLSVKPNQVFVIPPKKSMSILDNFLHLFEPVPGLKLPIDIFFKSLADDRGDNCIGIILSGMGSDGSEGLKSIKEKNGIVLVQDPVKSKFDGMPRSAIASVIPDVIASAYELPGRLIALLKNTPNIKKDISLDDKNKSNLEKIVILLRSQTGHDFSMYKKNTLYRRVERRMTVHQIDRITNYVRFLQENPSEIEILFKELLIGVTSFFRDANMWNSLRDKVLPELFNDLPNGYILRVWIPACSTGEEAYSFAIVFKEAYEKIKGNKNLSLQIFATDIDIDAIEIARRGMFNLNIASDVSKERLDRFFSCSDNNKYYASASIREMIVFAPHDVIKDPPFSKLDFLLCRNLLIYLEPELQRKLLHLFYYCLNANGMIVLGSAETPNSQDLIFTTVDMKMKIYRRTLNSKEIENVEFPRSLSQSIKRPTTEIISNSVNNIASFAEQLLLQSFSPASVLINQEGDILYITGKTGKYLEPAAGRANMNIYSMAREGLRNDLLGAVRKAKKSCLPVYLTNVRVGTNEGSQFVDIIVHPTKTPDAFKDTIMIVFKDVEGPHTPEGSAMKKGRHTSSDREKELEKELQRSQEELQSSREEMQTSQEELKSINEELQSTNEELQSTNEELTTSKEEMQSLNEELQTVNMELQTKVVEYMEANNDMKNLLNSTDIATLFLDNDLNIRRFTERLTKLIKLRSTDIGRPLTDMFSELNYPGIVDDAKEVLDTLMFKENDMPSNEGRWFKVRIMPYRTLDERIDGVVITFIEVTMAKKMEEELKKADDLLHKYNLIKT